MNDHDTHRKSTQEIRKLISKDATSWTVLIVDDEPDNVGVAQKVLEFHGATIYTAANGEDGLVVLEEVMPSFILLDLSMPQMDGWEMLRRMRAEPELRLIPVIAVTAHAMHGDMERVLDAGFDAYIAKPFRISTFLDEIRQVLERITVSSNQ